MSKAFKLKDISIIIGSGITPSRSNPRYWENGSIPWLKTEQLGEYEINDTTEKITQAALNETSIKIFPVNTLSIAMYGEGKTRGNVSILKREMTTNQACCNVVIDKEKADYKFVYYYLKTQYMQLRNLSSGVRKNLNSNDIKDFEIILPEEYSTQHKIASVLSALDSKIELNKRINAELEAMAKTLYDYWFMQFDFPNGEGKPYKASGGKMSWREELQREIPEGWEVKCLSEIVDVSNDSLNPMDTPDKEFRHYSIPAFDQSGTYIIENGEEIKSNKFIVKDTDILVSKLNPWFSRVIYSTDDSDLICSTEFVVWRTENIALKNYMYMIARDASFITYCTQSATGTSNSHKRVNPTVMMKYQIAYKNEIAELFGSNLGSTIKMYAKNQIENNILSELRDWLLPMLMNGQIKVVEHE